MLTHNHVWLGNNKNESQEDKVNILKLDPDNSNDIYLNICLRDNNNKDADLNIKYDIENNNPGNNIIKLNKNEKYGKDQENKDCLEDIFESPGKHLKDNLDLGMIKIILSPSKSPLKNQNKSRKK